VAPLLPAEPRAGIGDTRFGAAVAAALATRDAPLVAIPPGGAAEEAAFLAPLPIGLLPAPELEPRFALFGLRRIGELAALPRSAIVARFGSLGGELHDLARGLDGRPLRPRRPIERLCADAELDPPVEDRDALRFVLHHLAGALCAQLAARGAGAAKAILELERGAPLRIEQVLPEPVALPELVERLLVARLEVTVLPAPATRLALELDGTTPQAGTQLGLFTPQSAGADRLAWQLAGLAIRFGPGRIWRVELRDPEAPLAEGRVAWTAAGEGTA
jgi:protein ImuB